MPIDFPNSPSVNQIYTVGSRSWKWDGSTWAVKSPSPNLYVQDSAPSSPQTGDQWYESDTGRWFLYYDSAWVEIGNSTDVGGALQPGQVTALSAVTSLTTDDVFPVIDNPSSATAANKITYGNLVTAMSSSLAPGLVLITSGITTNAGNSASNGVVTVGSAVSSVEVYGAFSNTYDNYRVIYTGGAGSAIHTLTLQFGVGASMTATNYFGGAGFINVGAGTWQLSTNNGTTSATSAGGGGTTSTFLDLQIQMPNLAENTYFSGPYVCDPNGQFGQCSYAQLGTTQFTSFRIAPSTGTITGGKIRIYGYRNS